MRSVAIIGSFQKYYEDVLGLISLFKRNGFQVTSPYQSRITEARYGFVIFEADDKSLTDDEIQTDTLRKILNADAVYVYDLDGYVGKTTCYEIGILMAKNVPLYYYAYPDDLPVPIAKEQVISPQDFIDKFKRHETSFLLPKKEKPQNAATLKTVFGGSSLLICGSMKFFEFMQCLQVELKEIGIDAIIPEDESSLPENQTPEEFNEFKRKVSRDYLRKIRESGTLAILVLNAKKNEIDNYIGANTLAEIVMAFSWGRKIFIYNDFYSPLSDELIAWECVPIHQDLAIIKDYFDRHSVKPDSRSDDTENSTQFVLFDKPVTEDGTY